MKLLLGLWLWISFIGSAHAQKVIVLTDADMGKEIASAHRFTDAAPSLTLTLKHRLGAVGPLEITSPKAGQFDGAFKLSQSLPLTLMPGEARDLTLSVSYSKSIKEASEMVLLVGPAGDKDPKKIITLKMSVSAEGRMMFWDERNKQYVSNLPTLIFDGASDKLLELSWNGAGTGGQATVGIEGDARGVFKLIPNASGAQPLANGSSVNMGKGGQSYFVRYAGNPKRGSADVGRVVFTDANGKSVSAELLGTYKGGAAALASNGGNSNDPNYTGPGKVGIKGFDLGKSGVKSGQEGGQITHNTGIPGLPPTASVVGNNPDAGTIKPVSAKDKPVSVLPPAGFKGSITDPVMAKAHLTNFWMRRKGENIISTGEITFRDVEGFYQARFKIIVDSLDKDPSMNINPIWVSALSGEDSIPVPMTNVEYDQDSMLLRVTLPSEAEDVVSSQDSFLLKVGFMPEYMAGNQPVYLDDQKNLFTGSTIGRLYSESYFMLFVWLGIILFVASFFVLGFLWIRRPLTTFRYLRESRYQRERYVGRDEEFHIEIETVHIDLSRRDTDLIQLAYNLHTHSGVTGARDETTGKVRALEATVTAPHLRGLKRFFVWFYGIFGVKKEPRFRSVYYSLRIEPVQGGIPQNLRLKDESGVLLLGTSLTGNVLATDHQDFRFTERPFQYRIYVDPSEILDYSGTMRTVTIPFRVIEEPFEGYVMTREFRLNLEVQNKA